MKETDIIIIGAGPTGLFAVFEAGLLRLKCHLIDTLPQPGGQLTELYPKKPIFDIPGYPSVGAGELIDNLMEQIKQFQPEFTLSETAVTLEKQADDTFIVTTDKGTQVKGKAVAIAGGLGTFEPRKPEISNLADYEDKGVEYFVKNPERFAGKRVVIAGGGDSALDWSIYLSSIAQSVTLVHRRNEFRAAFLEKEGAQEELPTDYFIPLFGLTPKLGPIADWGLEIERNAIKVNNALDYQTNIEGVYAIGDVNTYPGKLKLILCGFHEATLMCQGVYNRLYPTKKYVLKYTTVAGVDGFDGSRKEAEKAVIQSI